LNNVKVKPLTKEQLTISIDRLTRFKNPEVKYLRVFGELITNNLIQPKYKKSDIEKMDSEDVKALAELIINHSLENFGLKKDDDYVINQRLYDYEKSVFALNENIENLLKNKINYKAFVTLIDENSPKNLKWLKALGNTKNIKQKRFEDSLRFPIEKVVITEGITEEILLPVFAEHFGYDFDKKGIQVISAGGKNQVVKLVYTLAEQLKLPMFILLDNDAQANYEQILPKLRSFDKIHLLSHGEFEDILPKELILKTLNDYFKNLNYIEEKEFEDERMVKNLEEIFKRKGFHEFKKAEFAQLVKSHISTEEDLSDEIKSIINELKSLTSFVNQ